MRPTAAPSRHPSLSKIKALSSHSRAKPAQDTWQNGHKGGACPAQVPSGFGPKVGPPCQGLQTLLKRRACLKNRRGSAAMDFGRSLGGEAGESPQRALTAEPTTAAAKIHCRGTPPIFQTGSSSRIANTRPETTRSPPQTPPAAASGAAPVRGWPWPG